MTPPHGMYRVRFIWRGETKTISILSASAEAAFELCRLVHPGAVIESVEEAP